MKQNCRGVAAGIEFPLRRPNAANPSRRAARPHRPLARLVLLAAALALGQGVNAQAQDNYEIQVYGSELVAPGNTMVELHSNYTFSGSTTVSDGMLPTNDQLHETVEITHGFSDFFETGFYIFTAQTPGYGYQWVGDHIRPRFSIPESWHWPVGLSISNEIGYARPLFAHNTWTWEIRPIIDKQMGRLYWSVNPVFDKSFQGPEANKGYIFGPSGTVTYDVTKLVNVGVEYYSSLGDVLGFDPFIDQSHQIFAVLNLNFSPQWEFNIGPGWGLTNIGDHRDHFILKMIIGRRFDFHW
jgi:hypothetical protein